MGGKREHSLDVFRVLRALAAVVLRVAGSELAADCAETGCDDVIGCAGGALGGGRGGQDSEGEEDGLHDVYRSIYGAIFFERWAHEIKGKKRLTTREKANDWGF